MTDPCGRVFVSYRRTRTDEVADLTRKLKVRGIPLWVDVSDLGHGSTEAQIKEALADENCAGAIAWVTPDVIASAVIRRIEVPEIVRRARRRDGFFAVMAIAGVLTYAEAGKLVAENLGTEDLTFWNMHKIAGDPAPPLELAGLADVVLRERLRAVAAVLPAEEPWRVGVWVRREPPADHRCALHLAWHENFKGRHAARGAWEAELLPALRSIHDGLSRVGVDRGLVFEGYPTLSTAVALGRTFPAVAGINVKWEQVSPSGGRSLWSLGADSEPSGYAVTTQGSDPGGDGLAVVVSVAQEATVAYRATTGLAAMRATIEVAPAAGTHGHQLTEGGACDLAQTIARAVRNAKTAYLGVREVHLFLACPVGLAMMIGQLLNAVGPITVYEHVDDDAVGHYEPEVTIPGSGSL